MKQKIFFLIMAIIFSTSISIQNASAVATNSQEFQPQQTSDLDIALLYYVISGKKPDLKYWIEKSKEFQETPDFNKETILRKQVKFYMDKMTHINFNEPIIIETPISLSNYNHNLSGYLIKDFDPKRFFSFSYIDDDIAVIPTGIEKLQWISVDTDTAFNIEKNLVDGHNKTRLAMARLRLIPTYGEKKGPFTLKGGQYWLISAKVDTIELWSLSDGKESLWTTNQAVKSRDDGANSSIFDLYQ